VHEASSCGGRVHAKGPAATSACEKGTAFLQLLRYAVQGNHYDYNKKGMAAALS
jgi:hypothetical protein